MITREKKSQDISALAEKFGKAKAAFLVDFKGMTVEQVTTLRKRLFPTESEMKVVRNTLALRALNKFPDTEKALSESLTGNNAVVFAYGDVSAPAKVLSDMAKDIESMQLKIGVMDGRQMNQDQIKYLATLPSKDVLRAQLLGVLAAPASKFVRTLNAVPSGFVRVLAAHNEKNEAKA